NYPESDREELEDALSFAEESLADGMYTANQVDATLMELSRDLADANEFFAEEESVAQLSVGDIDFGAIDEDDLASAQARLEVENTGDVPVTVSDITLNNGESFTVSEGDHEPIEPGGVETSSGIAPADDLEPGTYEDDVHVAFEGGEATATVRIDVQEVSGSPGQARMNRVTVPMMMATVMAPAPEMRIVTMRDLATDLTTLLERVISRERGSPGYGPQ